MCAAKTNKKQHGIVKDKQEAVSCGLEPINCVQVSGPLTRSGSGCALQKMSMFGDVSPKKLREPFSISLTKLKCADFVFPSFHAVALFWGDFL